jgi:thiamine-phosphate pyrophosphorylase
VQGLYAIVDVPDPQGLSPEAMTRAVLGDRLEGGRDGASVVQLRAKHATTEERVRWLAQLVPLCRAAGAICVVDDDIEAALAGDADGVHLGQADEGADDVAAVRAQAAARGRGVACLHPANAWPSDDAPREHAEPLGTAGEDLGTAGEPSLGSPRRSFSIGLSTHYLGQLRAAGRQSPDYLALGPVAPTRSKANPDPVVGLSGLLDGCRVASRPLVAIGGLDLVGGCRAIEAGAAAVAVIGALRSESPAAVRERAITLARAFRAAAAPLELDEVCRRIPVLEPELLAELARWGDALGVHLGLGLPARFGPRTLDGRPLYRPCDVIDLVYALGKRPDESWDAWRERSREDEGGPLVQLRRE